MWLKFAAPHLQAVVLALRILELSNIQLDIETIMWEVEAIQQERQREGFASRATASLNARATRARAKLRKLFATWLAWTRFMRGAAAAAAAHTIDLGAIMRNTAALPWRPALAPGTLSRQQLELRLFQAEEELARTEEEQAWFRSDAANVLRALLHRQSMLIQALKATELGGEEGASYMLQAQLNRAAEEYKRAKALFAAKGLV